MRYKLGITSETFGYTNELAVNNRENMAKMVTSPQNLNAHIQSS